MGWYVFVAEVTVTREPDGRLAHVLVGVDAISLTDFGWSRQTAGRIIRTLVSATPSGPNLSSDQSDDLRTGGASVATTAPTRPG